MSLAPTHHPAEETLLRHAAGTLPTGRALVVAAHMPFCPDCQAAVWLGEAIGGALLADMPAAKMTSNALTRTMARLDTPVSRADRPMERAMLAPGVPLPVELDGLVRSNWRWVAPGISSIAVRSAMPNGLGEHIRLLRVAPGKSMPDHGHRGWEATCVLAGSFADSTGEYGPGDVAEWDGEVMHQPVAGMGEPCICLIAWEGRLRMRGLLARLLQPLMGI